MILIHWLGLIQGGWENIFVKVIHQHGGLYVAVYLAEEPKQKREITVIPAQSPDLIGGAPEGIDSFSFKFIQIM